MVGRLLRRERGDRDDAAALARLEVGEAEVEEPDGRHEEDLDRMLERLGRDRGRGAGRRAAGVPDEHVDAAERLHGRLDRALEILGDRDVAADGERSDAVGLALEQVAPACEHRDVRAFGSEGLGRCEPEPGGRARDEGGAPFQSEIHGCEPSFAGFHGGNHVSPVGPLLLRTSRRSEHHCCAGTSSAAATISAIGESRLRSRWSGR